MVYAETGEVFGSMQRLQLRERSQSWVTSFTEPVMGDVESFTKAGLAALIARRAEVMRE